MPLNTEQLANIYKFATDEFGKRKPVDQINIERPLLTELLKSPDNYVGGPYFTDQLYVSNGDKGTGYSGYQRLSFSEGRPVDQVKFRVGNYHLGRVISDDELRKAGVKVTDDKGARADAGETVVLTNMLTQLMTQMDNACEEGLNESVWLDGSQDAELTPGVDALISLTPAVGTVGGVDASVNTYWRNYAKTGIGSTLATVMDELELARRAIRRTGGRIGKIYAGADAIDIIRRAVIAANMTQVNYSSGAPLKIDLATDTLKFDGTPIEWVPEFDTNFGRAAPTIPWSKRLYMMDMRHLKLERDAANFRRVRYAGRPIDQLAYYFSNTSTFGLKTNKRNTHGVLAFA